MPAADLIDVQIREFHAILDLSQRLNLQLEVVPVAPVLHHELAKLVQFLLALVAVKNLGKKGKVASVIKSVFGEHTTNMCSRTRIH